MRDDVRHAMCVYCPPQDSFCESSTIIVTIKSILQNPFSLLGHIAVLVTGTGSSFNVLLIDKRFNALLYHRNAWCEADPRLRQNLRMGKKGQSKKKCPFQHNTTSKLTS